MSNYTPEVGALIKAGSMLANCAFNLEQIERLTLRERRSLDESRKAWDEAHSAYAATLRQQAGRVDADVSEQVRRLREFVAESPEHYFGIGTCKIIGSHDRNYSVRDNLLYMIDRISEAALAQNTQGEAEGIAEIYDALPHCSERTTFTFTRDKLQALLLHAERARVPDRTGPIALFTGEEVHEAYRCLRTHNHSIPDACLDQMREVLLAAVDDDYDAAAPSQRAEVNRG